MKTIITNSLLDAVFHVQDGNKLGSSWFYNLKDTSEKDLVSELQTAFKEQEKGVENANYVRESLLKAQQENRLITKESNVIDVTKFLLKLRLSSKI